MPDRDYVYLHRGLPSDLSDWIPGEMGTGISIDESLMPGTELVRKRKMYKSHAFEEYVSEMVGEQLKVTLFIILRKILSSDLFGKVPSRLEGSLVLG